MWSKLITECPIGKFPVCPVSNKKSLPDKINKVILKNDCFVHSVSSEKQRGNGKGFINIMSNGITKTKLIIEQHIHGCFGVDFNKAGVDDMIDVSKQLLPKGIGGFFPTLVTDTVDNLKRQVEVIKEAFSKQTWDCSKILGIHLEGNFLNPAKKGIHDPKLFMDLTKENFEKIDDDFIKIVTLAPERDIDLIEHLHKKGVKVQAGHCEGDDLSGCDGVTHIFNAMKGINHREPSTALSALNDDRLYAEVIADGVHLSDDIMKLTFKMKPVDKIMMVSDALPITHSDLKEAEFAGSKIFYDGEKATSKDGTLAGSTTLVPDMVKILGKKGTFKPKYIDNVYDYHQLNLEGCIDWDSDYNIVSISKKY